MAPALFALVLLTAGAARDRAELKHALKDTFHVEDTPCTSHDEAGQPFSTCFDPWQGVELGGGAVVSLDGATGGFLGALRFRGERESRSKSESTWLSLHRVAAVDLRSIQSRAGVSLTGWSGLFRRHVAEGVLLVPTTPPLRVPFPFDIAIAGDALRWERRLSEGDDWALEPVRIALLLDPVRASSSRFHVGVGVVAGYRVRQMSGALQHDITPLTAGTLFVNLESEDGLWVLRASATAGWTFAPGAMGGAFRARGELDAARVLLALNDQPISVFVHGGGAWADAGARASSELAVLAGLRLQLFSSR